MLIFYVIYFINLKIVPSESFSGRYIPFHTITALLFKIAMCISVIMVLCFLNITKKDSKIR